MGFSRQEYWSGLPFPPPGDPPEPGTEPASLMRPVFAGEFFTTSAPWEAPRCLQAFSILWQLIPEKNDNKIWLVLRQ